MKIVSMPMSLKQWKDRARWLLAEGVRPADMVWSSQRTPALLIGEPVEFSTVTPRKVFRVPQEFHAIAETVACHRSEAKWDILYRILWKLTQEKSNLLKMGLDDDLIVARQMTKEIHRDCHKMKAFVRFREIKREEIAEGVHFVAWFEPCHLILRRVSPFFQKRFTNMNWTILTPDLCAHWDQAWLCFTPGVSPEMARGDDAVERLWETYYTHIFNPARLKEAMMCSEMPKKYWKNLPEAKLIPGLIKKGRRQDLSRDGFD